MKRPVERKLLRTNCVCDAVEEPKLLEGPKRLSLREAFREYISG